MPQRPKHVFTRLMPNVGSPWQTLASLMIDTHYARLNLEELWTWERYVRLANFLEMTVHELASLCLLPHRNVEPYQARGRLPALYASRYTALFLTLIEGHVMRAFDPTVIINPFPDLNRIPSRGLEPTPSTARLARERPKSSAPKDANHARPEGT